MDTIIIRGNFFTDAKPSAITSIEKCGKSVTCDAIISREVVAKKTEY